MARAAQRSRKRAKKPPGRRKRTAANPVNQQPVLFFDRLRRNAKWVYIFLIVVFAGGFVFLGVGSGSTGIGDLLNGNISFFGIGGGSSGGSSVSKAEAYVKTHPHDAKGYRKLVRAYQTNHQNDKSIAVLEQLVRLRPKDKDALSQLASLYFARGQRYQAQVQAAQLESEGALSANTFAPAPSGKLGQALGTNPLTDAVNSTVQQQTAGASSKMQQAYANEIRVAKQLAAIPPPDPSAVFDLVRAAEAAGDTATELSALKRFVKLAPQDPLVPDIRKRIAQLQKSQAASVGQTGGG